ncbi:MAG: ribosome small subunit-dependent GTPase A [Thermoguttaceae bacterium]|nr:ribosome small subunit-dependent GTPase A [Thermoguttaceae bacterium]MDW8079549.1 ribosome small subunit-dependent GTPase A [Thermoguttaceae bacterium]
MGSDKKKKKIRADFRKHVDERERVKDLTRRFSLEEEEFDSFPAEERLTGKGKLRKRRTIVVESADEDHADAVSPAHLLEVDLSVCRPGRILSVHGATCEVEAEDGQIFRCAVRRLLKTIQSDYWNVVAAGDRVLFRPVEGTDHEGVIERVEPRHGILSRKSRGRQQVIVANVDQLLIVVSAAEPPLKPNLIDRLLISAEKGRIRPIICINKIDLVDPAELMPLVGIYAQLGYQVILTSATTGFGMERLRRILSGQQTVLAGQSGVGKSSLLNAIDPNFRLRVQPVSPDTHKGRHTTTTARVLRLASGGYVVDTPGIRQFELWDVVPEEIASLFPEFRPYLNGCRFPDCTHLHETDCAVKNAVADARLDIRRYESYCHLMSEEEEDFEE